MIKLRIPPSPTGVLHIGTLRTALYNYLFAKQNNGQMLFRSEDTDKLRSTKEFEDSIISGLNNLGLLEKNTEIIRQSERSKIYQKYLIQLIDQKDVYYCFCTAEELDVERNEQIKNKQATKYSGKCRCLTEEEVNKKLGNGDKAVIRFKVPENKEVIFQDLVRGENKTNTKELGDFVIAKDLNTPLYNFVVVVDDYLMEITHILRGEDHLPNTPKQILIYQAFSWDIPNFAHLPLILNQDKSKLSKRKNKVSVDDYLADGYLPEALLNFLVLLGWNDGTEEEIFSLDEMVEKFSLERVHKGGAVFDLKKLDWINSQYIRKLSVDELFYVSGGFLKKLSFYDQVDEKGNWFIKKVLESVQFKLMKLSELGDLIKFYYQWQCPEKDLIVNPKMKVNDMIAEEAIRGAIGILNNLDNDEFTVDIIKEELIKLIKEEGWKNGQLLWPVRSALSGLSASPSPFEIIEILGRAESVRRLEKVLQLF